MKVILLSPPYVPEYMRNARCDYVSLSKTQWYPIWLAYCGALLEKHGCQVELIDAPSYGLKHIDTEKLISKFKPDWLVVYSSTKSENNDISFTERIMELTGCKSVFVGPFVSIKPGVILEKSNRIKFAVKGEFEYPVLELVTGCKPEDIKNLIYRKDNLIIENPQRPQLSSEELDNLPFVTDFYKRYLDIKKYRVPQELYPFVDLFTGRGCEWGICSFCLWVHSFIKGPSYNKRSMKNVIEEIKFVKREIKQAKEIFIQDDTLPEERAVELSESIIKEKIDVIWSCYLRAEIGYDALKLMKDAGCRTVHVGYESASAQVLKNCRKGISKETMTKFTNDAKRAGLRIHGDFLIGLNGETAESILETIRWAKEIRPHTAQFSIINIYPNTPFYEYLKKNNYIENGEPSYPYLPKEKLRGLAKKGYREFYLNWESLKLMMTYPREYFFQNMVPIIKMFFSIFWKRW